MGVDMPKKKRKQVVIYITKEFGQYFAEAVLAEGDKETTLYATGFYDTEEEAENEAINWIEIHERQL